MTYDKVEVQKGLDIIRKRPGQFIGNYIENGYSDGLMSLLREVVGNSVDEYQAGFCDTIIITYNPFLNEMKVEDNGRGIPFNWNEEEGISNLQLCCGRMYAGAKYNKSQHGSPYRISIGMNGIGLTCVNALSSTFVAQSFRKGEEAFISYSKGEIKIPFEHQRSPFNKKSGTIITWIPDQSILPFRYKEEFIKRYCQEVSYLNKGLKIVFYDNIKEENPSVYLDLFGIPSYIHALVKDKEIILDLPLFSASDEKGNSYEIAMKVVSGSTEVYYPYVNGNLIETSSTPVVALRQSFAKTITQYIKDYAKLTSREKKIDIQSSDIRAGICAVIKLLHIDPAFDAQTKTKLINRDISDFINQTLPEKILEFLLKHQDQSRRLVLQVLLQAQARIAADNARKNTLTRETRKLQDLNISLSIFTPPLSKEPWKNDLYLFEGQSASGALIKASKEVNSLTGKLYKEHIGVLALRGVTLNVLELDLKRAQQNIELATLIDVGGLDPKNPDNLTGLNFNRFIIATDADDGGHHISTLLVTFFFKFFPEIIRQGKLCRVITPLFELQEKFNKKLHFIYPDQDPNQYIESIEYKPGDVNKKFILKRNKGLGEQSDACNMTLVDNPRLQFFTPNEENWDLMNTLFYTFSGKDWVDKRKKLIFDLGLKVEK